MRGAVRNRAEWLQELKVEYANKVTTAVEAFLSGGLDLERRLDGEAEALPGEIVAECKAVNARLWGRVKPKPKPPFGVLGFGPAKPKRVEQKPANDEVGPQIEAAPS